MSELDKIKPPVQREIRSVEEARAFMSRFTCPENIRTLAVSLWEIRHKETRGVITRGEALLAEHELMRNVKADDDRRFKASAYARLIAMDNAIVTEQRAQDDPEDDPGAEGDLGWESCPKCGGEDINLEYNSKSDSIDCSCARCSYGWNAASLTQEEISSARQRGEMRKRMRAARGF